MSVLDTRISDAPASLGISEEDPRSIRAKDEQKHHAPRECLFHEPTPHTRLVPAAERANRN